MANSNNMTILDFEPEASTNINELLGGISRSGTSWVDRENGGGVHNPRVLKYDANEKEWRRPCDASGEGVSLAPILDADRPSQVVIFIPRLGNPEYNVEAKRDALEALKQYRRSQPDISIVMLDMGEWSASMAGADAAKADAEFARWQQEIGGKFITLLRSDINAEMIATVNKAVSESLGAARAG